MIKIAICDDENIIASQIESLILDVCKREVIPVETDVFYSGETLEKEILEGTRYDLLYLDIQMKEGNGIVTAQNIREIDENVLIIYVSGYDKYMIELFRLDVFAFIRKPIGASSFTKTFLEANKKICRKNFYFTFRYKNQEYKIPCKEILYFESNGRQIRVNLRSGDVEVFNGKLSDIAMQLADGKIPFLRIHQSYLVNYHLIKSRSKTNVTLINGKKLSISEDKKKEFNREYGMLLGGEVDA